MSYLKAQENVTSSSDFILSRLQLYCLKLVTNYDWYTSVLENNTVDFLKGMADRPDVIQ